MLNMRQHPHLARLSFRYRALVLRPAWSKAAGLARRALHHKAKVLDVGCGMGGFCEALHYHHLKVTGLEKDPWVLQEAGRRLPHAVELILAGEHFLPAGSFAMAVTSLSLHCRTVQQRQGLIQEMRRLAPLALFMDWQLAEHHLAVPLVGAIAGLERLRCSREHYTNYLEYMKNGGFEGMLYQLKDEGRVIARASLLGGTLGCAVLEWD